MEDITIQLNDDGWTVSQGNKYAVRMTFDEMLGTIAAITMPRRRPCVHWLRTKEEHENWLKEMKRRSEEIQ